MAAPYAVVVAAVINRSNKLTHQKRGHLAVLAYSSPVASGSNGGVIPCSATALVKRLQLFARLKANRLARRDCYFSSCPWIAPDTGFSRTHVENAEPPQFNAIPFAQGLLHGLEHRLDSHFGFCFCDTGPVNNFVDDVQLNQAASDAWLRSVTASERCRNLNDKKEVSSMSTESHEKTKLESAILRALETSTMHKIPVIERFAAISLRKTCSTRHLHDGRARALKVILRWT